MLYTIRAYKFDTRPEKPEGEENPDRPEGGFRNKSGIRKLGTDATVDGSVADALDYMGKAVKSLKKDQVAGLAKIVIEVEDADGDAASDFLSGL